jgi:hypothetical protein
MKRAIGILMGLAAVWTCLSLAVLVSGQSPLERIEGQIRNPGGPGSAPAVPGNPLAVPAPPTGPGAKAKSGDGPYLGAIADDRDDRGRGVRVLEVRPGGPADRAGLRPQDLVVGAATARVRQMSDLTAVLEMLAPGDKVELDILRGVQPQKVVVTLGRRTAPAAPPTELLPAPPKEPVPAPVSKPPSLEPPSGPAISPPPPAPAAAPIGESASIEQLQRRVEQLERRVEELERALAEARKKP